jgi:N-methylhydantoinase B
MFRGGTGGELEMVVETAVPALGNTAGDGIRHGARGMLGGGDGKPHHYILRRAATGEEIVLGTKMVGVAIEPGDRLLIHSGGGGGWGDPAQRTAEARQRDVDNGLVGPTPAPSPKI